MRLGTVIWRRFRRNRLSFVGAIIVVALGVVAIAAQYVAPYSPTDIDIQNVLSPPSKAHPLGTDDLGRDVLSRMIYGSQISLSVGFVAVGIAVFIGIIIGSIAGYKGGWVDDVLMRFTDVMLTFPSFFLILAIIAIVGPGIWVIMIVIGITSWMGVARLVRAEFLTLRQRDFVHAAQVIGANDGRIIFLHLLPNAMAPVFVTFTLGVASAILVEAALSFLGLGVQPPDPSWGNILTTGKDYIEVAWWLSVFPGLAILVTVLSYNLVGEGLRDALDPRLWDTEGK